LRCNIISEKSDTLHVAIHERLGEVLRILRSVLEKYPALQSSELLVTAGTLIQQVKGNMRGELSWFWMHCEMLCKAYQPIHLSLHETMHLLVNDYNEFFLKPISQILFYIKILYMKNSVHL
jgi:hypothetical protein